METSVLKRPGFRPVNQFTIHADNKVGRLNEIVGLLGAREVHIMALSILDTTDSAIIRLIVDYPEEARAMLVEHNFSFVTSEVVVVEIETEARIKDITCALVQAEINIHYVYPFVSRPNGKSALAIRCEDNDLATETLRRHQLKVLDHHEIAR